MRQTNTQALLTQHAQHAVGDLAAALDYDVYGPSAITNVTQISGARPAAITFGYDTRSGRPTPPSPPCAQETGILCLCV